MVKGHRVGGRIGAADALDRRCTSPAPSWSHRGSRCWAARARRCGAWSATAAPGGWARGCRRRRRTGLGCAALGRPSRRGHAGIGGVGARCSITTSLLEKLSGYGRDEAIDPRRQRVGVGAVDRRRAPTLDGGCDSPTRMTCARPQRARTWWVQRRQGIAGGRGQRGRAREQEGGVDGRRHQHRRGHRRLPIACGGERHRGGMGPRDDRWKQRRARRRRRRRPGRRRAPAWCSWSP